MTVPEIIALVAVLLVGALALLYIFRSKKKGKKCIGCPYACECSGKGGSCSESAKTEEK